MLEETKQYYLQMAENILSRTMHDIISPLTAIVNSSSILSSREVDKKNSDKKAFPTSKLLEIIEDAIHQIFNQINLTRYLYTIGREKFLVSSGKFSQDWNEIMKKYEIEIKFEDDFFEIWNYEAQLASHIFFILSDITPAGSEIIVNKIDNGFCISGVDSARGFDELLSETLVNINQININIHFFRFLLRELGYKFVVTNSTIEIIKF
jgi:signal transduction histidine kinase